MNCSIPGEATDEVVAAVQAELKCERVEYRWKHNWVCLAHFARPWSSRGCPVAVATAEAAHAVIAEVDR